MNDSVISIKKHHIVITFILLALTFQHSAADYNNSLSDKDFSTEQTIGRLATLKAGRVAEVRTLADKWSSFTEESLDNLFRTFYRARDEQLLQIMDAQNYATVRAILSGQNKTIAAQKKSVVLNKLGDHINVDLVYSPVIPCRIVNTKVSGGAMSGEKRSFFVHGTGTKLASQGGNPEGCIAPFGDPAAVQMIMTANPISPSTHGGKGDFQVTAHRTLIPKAVVLKYKLGTNTTNVATVMSAIATETGKDIDLQVNGQLTHLTLDVMGYYYPVSRNDADRLAIAYGIINADGSKASGTENFTSRQHQNSHYHIKITGEEYIYDQYTTIVTLIENPRLCNTAIPSIQTAGDGDLKITIRQMIGERAGIPTTQCKFSFVTFKNQ